MTVRIAITPGEPAGIGPDLCVQLAQQAWPVQLVLFGCKNTLQQRAEQLNIATEFLPYQPNDSRLAPAGSIFVQDIPCADDVVAGQLNVNNGAYVVETLRQACQANMDGEFDAVVTGPVHKGIINQSGMSFSGHTEFFATESNTPQVVMMLATEGLRVTLATTHIPLAYVSKAITQERLTSTIRIIDADMRSKFGIQHPHIYVCGLNPHAGEDGHLGREELDVIIPALEKLRQENIQLTGPLPADSLFQPKYLENADVVLAMYHDQGLPVLKHKGFGRSVNITLGLPFIRTSVDHGTALDIAGSGQADAGSFICALQQAIELVNQRQ